MTQDEIDTMWQQAMYQSIKESELFTRYRFAKLVAAKEREACAVLCDALQYDVDAYGATCAEAIRARGEQA